MARQITRTIGNKGPVISIEIQPVPEQRAALAAQGYPANPVEIDALIDTGSSNTIIPRGIGRHFGATFAGTVPVVGFGVGDEAVLAKRYFLGISVVGIEMAPLQIMVREIDLSEQHKVHAVVGWDVLAYAEFTYTGGREGSRQKP